MKKFLSNKIVVPRWIIFSMDITVLGFSFSVAYFIVKFFLLNEFAKLEFILYTCLYTVVAGAVFFLMKIHTGLIRYSNIHDMLRIFIALFFASVIYPFFSFFLLKSVHGIQPLDMVKTLFINFFVASSLLIFLRATVKEVYFFVKQNSTHNVDKVLIYGTDLTSIMIKQTLETGKNTKLQVIGFMDANPAKVNTYIQQIKVYPVTALRKLHAKTKIDKMIMPNDLLATKEMQQIVDQCLEQSIKVYTVPPSDQWIYGKLSLNQIKDLKIEDLLQRDPIQVNNDKIQGELAGKCILVTGAAGSIGSEIARQIMPYEPGCLLLCDQAESSLHEFQLEMEEKYGKQKIKIFLGNVQSHERMALLFRQYSPQIVFHAAAYKHVPMMENHPTEAVLTNVAGTKNLSDLAVQHEVEKFVMISTDKAVNPTNIMGASKRIAEKYVQALNSLQDANDNLKTKFITTRFGNVLGSNGSVIPRFYKQIQSGGPVTVTDPEITRFFMTIPEAVQLVLEACTMGRGGEIFVFDMGQPVKIVDMARKMIRLTGLIPDRDVKIEFTGLRPGEKLYEEVLSETEKTIPTYHDKIRIAKVPLPSYAVILDDVLELISRCEKGDANQLVRKMKQMVPEFLSQNSVFELLDKKPEKELTNPQYHTEAVG